MITWNWSSLKHLTSFWSTANQHLSLCSKFHTTEDLLIERARLHGLVDFFWQQMPLTRDSVYQEISAILHIDNAHISDLNSQQIKEVAEKFHKYLDPIAPCSNCKHSHKTSYGIMLCNHPKGHGAYWLNDDSKSSERCSLNVPGHIPLEE